MRVRADIAGMIRAGHTDTRIAYELGCHRNTVHRVRQALRLPAGDQLERIYAEALPTGQVRAYTPPRMPISPDRAAANRAALAAAINHPAPTRPAAHPTVRKAS